MDRYDVIIVGGRPAGASLAARLGRMGRNVLVLDRATFPSQPTVPSCPTLHMGALALLDELGIPEAAYASDAVKFESFVIQFGGHFTARMVIPPVHGRTYGYSIDRGHFDQVLWDNLAQYPSVATRMGFHVDELLRDEDGRVSGVSGHVKDGPPERIEASWVVGADGRFSVVARQMGAKVVEEETEKVSTVYFADWTGVKPLYPGTDIVSVYTTGRGLNVLFFPLSGGRITICLHQRADRVDIEGDAEAYYRKVLDSLPIVAERLEDATMVSRLLGLKRVGNGYREPGGAGWVLTGDALHYKDPVDGQGIYDALVETRILADELDRALFDGKPDEVVIAAYDRRCRDATHDMYLATCQRLRDELYTEPPVPVIRTMIRWFLSDPEYQKRFLQFLGREIEPVGWMPKSVMAGAIGRGILRDLTGAFGGGTP
jgi:2-polyprenyl-6-methoxyphenol hydroxylase-like FAD-dependent oxidoreductase